jgi:DNA-binding transcriptional regulator YiaG
MLTQVLEVLRFGTLAQREMRKSTMYKYTECGLRNVRLSNGYKVHDTPYGKAVSITDVEGLHRAIGHAIARKPRVTGSELRFLRKELGWSQKMLATFLGVSEQIVSLWERKGRITKTADRLVRLVYLEKADGNVRIAEAVQRLAEMDRVEHEGMTFEKKKSKWLEAA